MAVESRQRDGHRGSIQRRRDTSASVAAPRIDPVAFEHEHLVVRRGERSGLYVVVAIHSTALGPALGGVRLWSYPTQVDAVRDALRLASGMTYKAAAAGLDLGGGKGVICAPPEGLDDPELRRAALLDFGDLVESLDRRYITAEDVGISPHDLVVIAERTDHVTGLPPEHGGSGDPSTFTALGVEAAMRACCAHRFESPQLAGRRVVVVGLGHVGLALARRLAEAGCELVVSDIVAAKREHCEALGAEWVEPGEAMTTACDVLAPCALGGAITAENIGRLRCEVICGSANNQLADDRLADELTARGILYAPDFVVNAGGLIHVSAEVAGYSESRALELVHGIEAAIDRILTAAERRGITPLAAAQALAAERLAAAGERVAEPAAAA